MRRIALPALLIAALSCSLPLNALASDQVTRSALATAKLKFHMDPSVAGNSGHIGQQGSRGTLGVDSVVNFASYFYVEDFPQDPLFFGFSWPYTMVGSSPFQSEIEDPTVIEAPIAAVTVNLLNADGSQRYVNGKPLISSADALIKPALKSPVFSTATYSSSTTPTQFADAVQRASFYNLTSRAWHTLLHPKVLPTQTIAIPFGSYVFALNADGTCCDFVLIDINVFGNAIFPPTVADNTTVLGALEVSGQINTSDITTLLFNNIYLYIGTPATCCVGGYHTYDLEPGTASNGYREKRFVMNYSAWISPGLFGVGPADVTALSHEMAETFADPFVGNQTPIWLSPNGNCQNNLEVGDVIEGLPKDVYPVTMNGFTYHPQNVALLQWFAGVTPSNALGGAYSYPDTTVLTSAAYFANFNCQ
jgi:hypothetical protein